VNRLVLVIALVVITLAPAKAQLSDEILLSEALLRVATEHKLAIVFDPSRLPAKYVAKPTTGTPVQKSLQELLRGSGYQYDLTTDEILLYKETRLYGYVTDSSSGTSLIGATISNAEADLYAISNTDGYYTLLTIADTVVLTVQYLGYADKKVTLTAEQPMPITIALQPDNTMDEIIISDAMASPSDQRYIELTKGSDILLQQNQGNSAVGGEPDIQQAIARQTGVTTGADGVGGIHIRGGKNDQNQVLYDGVRLYHSSHAFGVYSMINNTVIDQASIHKVGATGAISGRLSSIVDVHINNPDLRQITAKAQVSTLASQACIGIPLVRDKVGIMMAGRRTHIDPILRHISKKNKEANFEDGSLNFHFSDFNLKLFAKLAPRHTLYFSAYGGTDSFTEQTLFEDVPTPGFLSMLDDNLKLDWSNKLASLRYNVLLGSSTVLDVQLSTYDYRYRNVSRTASFATSANGTPEYDRFQQQFDSGVNSHELRTDFQYHLPSTTIKYGATASLKYYPAGTVTEEAIPLDIDTSIPIPPYPSEVQVLDELTATDLTAYLSAKVRVKPDILVDGGLYLNHYSTKDLVDDGFINDASYLSVSGYIKTMANVTDRISLGAVAGRYMQNEHLLTTGDHGYPSDIWLPSTLGTPPQQSWQGEFFGTYIAGKHSMQTAIYYKHQQGLIIYDTLAVLPSVTILQADKWEEQTILTETQSAGVEMQYSYIDNENTSCRVAYSWGLSNYLFDDDLGTFKLPTEYSIPHTLSLSLNAKLSDRFRLVVDWYYSSGRPYTLYQTNGIYSPLERQSDLLIEPVSGFNEFRLQATHKLSAAISTTWQWGIASNNLFLGVQNIYDRRNQLYAYEDQTGINSQAGFPLLPMLRWRVSL